MRRFWRLALLFISLLTLTTGGFWLYLDRGLPDVRQVISFRPDGSLQMIAADGSVIYNHGSGPRTRVTFKELPQVLKQAAIASEDRRFYDHNGVDLPGIARAIVTNIRQGKYVEGGSTITQQVARTLFLSQEKTLNRKIQEALLALKMEQYYSKDEILTFYLNYSYFGAGAYGVADASQTYFGKSIAELTLSEAALLIGVLPAPSVYSPLSNPTLARQRRNIVLGKMERAGFITHQRYQSLTHQNDAFAASQGGRNSNAYFTSYVESILPTLIDPDLIERGGLLVETTLDVQVQAKAQAALRRAVWARAKQGAIVSLDPSTGEIRALVGGVDFQKSQFNRATQARRQPGSSFKTFVYLTALEQGIAPTKVYVDRPIRIGNYRPKNSDRDYAGPLTLINALARSRNTIAVQLLRDVGIEPVIATCRRLGITSPLAADLPLALGASGVSLLELTRAYGVLADQGTLVQTVAIRRILDRQGNVLYQAKPQSEQVVAPQTAWMMTRFLRYVVTNGTGRATHVPFPVAGKTGTSDQGRDLLFVGYTPKLVTGVWLGNDDETPSYATSSRAAQLWGQYMRQITPANSPDFQEPEQLDPQQKALLLAAIGRPAPVIGSPATSSPPPPAASAPVPPTDPIPFLPFLSTQEAGAPSPPPAEPSPVVAPAPNCYDPKMKVSDYRCRNRKN